MKNENIKTRVRIYFDDSPKPSMSIQEFNQLELTFQPDKGKLNIGDVINVEGSNYKLTSISTEVRNETRDDHLNFGVELALVGDR